jgi:hypothetical protein
LTVDRDRNIIVGKVRYDDIAFLDQILEVLCDDSQAVAYFLDQVMGFGECPVPQHGRGEAMEVLGAAYGQISSHCGAYVPKANESNLNMPSTRRPWSRERDRPSLGHGWRREGGHSEVSG